MCGCRQGSGIQMGRSYREPEVIPCDITLEELQIMLDDPKLKEKGSYYSIVLSAIGWYDYNCSKFNTFIHTKIIPFLAS